MPSGFVTPAASGGWVDLGVLNPVALLAGRQTLYTTSPGAFVSEIRFGDTLVAPDGQAGVAFELAGWNQVSSTDGYAYVGPAAQTTALDPVGVQVASRGYSIFNAGATVWTGGSSLPGLLAGSLTATLAVAAGIGQATLGDNPAWQANHTYTDALIVAAGHLWSGSGPGTSGGSIPNFAAHIGGSVVDGGVTWIDIAAVPTVGAIHVYIEVVTPAVP